MMKALSLAVAAFALPAAAAPPPPNDVSAIKAARTASNRAIAAHDLDSFLPMFADDAVFTWSNGSHAIGKKDLATFFARDFADPKFDRYVRRPKIGRAS